MEINRSSITICYIIVWPRFYQRFIYLVGQQKSDPNYFSNSHYASYFILNLCRLLYTVICKWVGDKLTPSFWVKGSFDSQRKDLIHQAESWRHGIELNLDTDALQFLDFVVDQVSQIQPFKQLESDLQFET